MTCIQCGRVIHLGDEVVWRRRFWHPRCVVHQLERAISPADVELFRESERLVADLLVFV